MEAIEIFCDASIREFPDSKRTFGCAGAICPGYGLQKLQILPDSTNNRAEAVAVLLAVKLAKEICNAYGEKNIIIYSDSQISVFAIRKWMPDWLKKRKRGILYNYSDLPVKNQEVYLSILCYLVNNNVKITLYHQKGHVNTSLKSSIDNARRVFMNSNYVDIGDKISEISNHNNTIDELTRNTLYRIDDKSYPVYFHDGLDVMCYYVPPSNYRDYILPKEVR